MGGLPVEIIIGRRRGVMRYLGVVLMAVLAFGAVGAAWGADGAELYAKKCTACHGPKGEGGAAGPALKGNPFVTKGKPDEIKQVITLGRTGADRKYPNFPAGMPAGLASGAEAEALLKYLQGDFQK
jgi:mono/diheme cytochrome c family protein